MGSKTKLISIYIRKVWLQQVSFRRTFWGTSACCKAQRKASTFARLHFHKSTECCAAAFHKLCPWMGSPTTSFGRSQSHARFLWKAHARLVQGQEKKPSVHCSSALQMLQPLFKNYPLYNENDPISWPQKMTPILAPVYKKDLILLSGPRFGAPPCPLQFQVGTTILDEINLSACESAAPMYFFHIANIAIGRL